MCPKEIRDGPSSSEHGAAAAAAAVVAPMRFDARPTFRPTYPPPDPVKCVPAYLFNNLRQPSAPLLSVPLVTKVSH